MKNQQRRAGGNHQNPRALRWEIGSRWSLAKRREIHCLPQDGFHLANGFHSVNGFLCIPQCRRPRASPEIVDLAHLFGHEDSSPSVSAIQALMPLPVLRF